MVRSVEARSYRSSFTTLRYRKPIQNFRQRSDSITCSNILDVVKLKSRRTVFKKFQSQRRKEGHRLGSDGRNGGERQISQQVYSFPACLLVSDSGLPIFGSISKLGPYIDLLGLHTTSSLPILTQYLTRPPISQCEWKDQVQRKSCISKKGGRPSAKYLIIFTRSPTTTLRYRSLSMAYAPHLCL